MKQRVDILVTSCKCQLTLLDDKPAKLSFLSKFHLYRSGSVYKCTANCGYSSEDAESSSAGLTAAQSTDIIPNCTDLFIISDY